MYRSSTFSAIDQDGLFRKVPERRFKRNGSCVGPTGRSFLAIVECEAAVQCVDFLTLAQIAVDNAAGIVVLNNPEAEAPEFELSFGACWAFIFYADLRGAPNYVSKFDPAAAINPSDPFQALANEKDKRMSLGEPSEAFLPQKIRQMITDEIIHELPDAKPEFYVSTEGRFIMDYGIKISLGCFVLTELKGKMTERLAWYLPPYLPLEVA